MAIQHEVQRLCYNRQVDSWIFICTKGIDYGYTLSDNIADMPEVIELIMQRENDVKTVITKLSSRFNQQPHPASGTRARYVPEPRQA